MIKAQILLSWLALSGGQVLLWRRRDNLFGYMQIGFCFAACVVPILGTTVVDDAPQDMAERYADLMTIGAITYLVGLAFGGRIANRMRLPRLSFGGGADRTSPAVALNARRIAIGGLFVMMLSFALLGYVPILAADRVGAKYGVGEYAAGFARGSLFYNVFLLVASTVLPVILVLVMRQRRLIDVVLAGALFAGLMASLSRQLTFVGPLVFLIALAIDRRWRAWAILACVCFAYVGSSAFNSLVSLTPLAERQSFADQVASATPDLVDHIVFLDGFERGGSEQLGMRPLTAALSLDKSEFNPSEYALKVRTGLKDITGLASGGLRLPAAVWGFASYGVAGAGVWCLVAGVFVGMGTVLIRRALTPSFERGRQLLPLVLAWVFYEGTFGVLAEFYFLPRVAVIGFGIAIVLGFQRGRAGTGQTATPTRASGRTAGRSTVRLGSGLAN